MERNNSIDDYIEHEGQRRQINAFYIALSFISICTAVIWSPLALMALLVIALFAGMSNLSMLLGTPKLRGSDEEIRAAASKGPEWFRRRVAKLDSEN